MNGDRALQVGLIETGQHLVRVEGLEMRVDVHLSIGGVHEAVHPDTGVAVLVLRRDVEAVGACAKMAQPEDASSRLPFKVTAPMC